MFCLPPNYRIRTDPAPFDDTPFTDEWQDAVYKLAADQLAPDAHATVVDWGCGSAFKLMKYFADERTHGVEANEETLAWLRQKYPASMWDTPGEGSYLRAPDLLICADVIEHVPDPSALMNQLVSLKPTTLVISTPLRRNGDLGPPANPHHSMEWNGEEFLSFVKKFVEVTDYKIVPANPRTQDLTQVVVGKPAAR